MSLINNRWMSFGSSGSLVCSSHANDAFSIPGKERRICSASWYVLPFTRSFIRCCCLLLRAYVQVPLNESTRVGVVWVGIAWVTVTWIVPSRLYQALIF